MAGVLVSATFMGLCSLKIVAFVYSLAMLFVLSPAFPRMMRLVMGTSRGMSCYFRRKKLYVLYCAEGSGPCAREVVGVGREKTE